jgi:1-acyl-sn-glycerol-3-phosphate acyltransferase
MGFLKCAHPPFPAPDHPRSQTLIPVTLEELRRLRKPPKYDLKHTLLQLLFFLIFAPIKVVFGLIYGVISGAIFIGLCAIWRAFGSPEPFRTPLKLLWSALSRILLFILGIYKINYHGQPDSDARFLISNHACFFDAWLLTPLLPRPLDKIELLSIPCFREIWEVFDGISVDRRRSCGMTKVLVDGAANSNQPMIQLFPEGATTNGDYMLRFHLGAFLSDLPVQPAAIRYTLWGTTKHISHISWFHNYPRQWIAFLSIPAITVDVTFLETVSMKKQDDENDPRRFADDMSLIIANFLGIPVVNMTSSAIYKANHLTRKAE